MPRHCLGLSHDASCRRGAGPVKCAAHAKGASGPREGSKAHRSFEDAYGFDPPSFCPSRGHTGVSKGGAPMAQLPKHPSLDRLRREARALQRACRAGEPSAIARLTAALGDPGAANLPLSRAQTVVARDYATRTPVCADMRRERSHRRERRAPSPRCGRCCKERPAPRRCAWSVGRWESSRARPGLTRRRRRAYSPVQG